MALLEDPDVARLRRVWPLVTMRADREWGPQGAAATQLALASCGILDEVVPPEIHGRLLYESVPTSFDDLLEVSTGGDQGVVPIGGPYQGVHIVSVLPARMPQSEIQRIANEAIADLAGLWMLAVPGWDLYDRVSRRCVTVGSWNGVDLVTPVSSADEILDRLEPHAFDVRAFCRSFDSPSRRMRASTLATALDPNALRNARSTWTPDLMTAVANEDEGEDEGEGDYEF